MDVVTPGAEKVYVTGPAEPWPQVVAAPNHIPSTLPPALEQLRGQEAAKSTEDREWVSLQTQSQGQAKPGGPIMCDVPKVCRWPLSTNS